jgi:signal transduction histidine kinase/CheY-like chemotaxis protein
MAEIRDLKFIGLKTAPPEVFIELVELMFTSLPSIVTITAIYAAGGSAISYRTGDAVIATLTSVGVLIGLGRIGLNLTFNRRAARTPLDIASATSWQALYGIAAGLFSACTGLLLGRALVQADTVSHLLASLVVFAYATGMVVRAAVRPLLAGSQVLLILLAPIAVAAAYIVTEPNAYYAALLVIEILLLIGAFQLIAFLHNTILERLLARRDLRLAKEAAENAQMRAEQASVAKSDFLATMSHEIRTPLNGIMGLTDLVLDRHVLDPELRRQIELVKVSGEALLTVVNDVLDFSKLEAGAVKLEVNPFWPKALVEVCAAMVRGLAVQKNLELIVSTGDTLPNRVVGDEARLRQILLNLLNNAIKFTPSGRVELRLVHAGLSPTEEHLCFSVSDTGIGIPAAKRDRLFERFSQVDGSRNRQYGGTGLGLAISKQLVELMGGTISLESEDELGTTVRVEVVLQRSNVAPMPRSDGRNAERIPFAVNRGRILVADDVDINQEIVRAVLETAGHSVHVVSDGAQVIKAVQERPYDLILMDVQMPGIDGVQATRQIRAMSEPIAGLPVIALTANVYDEQIASFLDAGMNDHVGKPIDRKKLLTAVNRWLANSSRVDEPALARQTAFHCEPMRSAQKR